MEPGSNNRETAEGPRTVVVAKSASISPPDARTSSTILPLPVSTSGKTEYQVEIPTASPDGHLSLFQHAAATTPLLEQLLFFACGVGTTICFIATLSSLVHFELLYGENSFIYLNLAVYLPLLPISLAQACWDQYYDYHYQSRNMFLIRGIVGFSMGLLGTIPMVHLRGLRGFVFYAALQGIGGAILYGIFNQMASFIGTGNDRKLKAALSSGVQASALVVLAASFFSGFGVENAPRFSAFVWTIVVIEALCFASFLYLVLARPMVIEAMNRRDWSLRCDEGAILEKGADSRRQPLMVDASSPAAELSFAKIYNATRYYCWLLIATLVPSFLVGSWFTRVYTKWVELASLLFYVRIAADFFGRLFTIIAPVQSFSSLRRLCIVRLALVGFFFINAHRTFAFSAIIADGLSIILVGIIAFLSGYIVTGCFQLAPLSLEFRFREANVTKQASMLTVAFAFSAVMGLLVSFSLVALRV